MSFDIRTLLVAVVLATIFCTGARLLLWRMHPAIPGLGRWALAGAAAVLALVMILFFGIFQWQHSLSLAQLFSVMALVLAWDGFRRFLGETPLSSLTLAGLAITVLAWISVMYFHHSTEIRAIGNAIIMAILSALIARELLIKSKVVSLAIRATGWVYAANAAIFFIRAVGATEPPQTVNSLDPNGIASVMLLWLLCLTIAVTLGMVLMTAERLQVDLDRQANHDPLTGALNRRSFSVLIEQAIAHSQRYVKPLSVLIMDLDNFKQINDRFGHDVGDEVLCRFVTVAEKVLRGEDIFCRFGGEEFVALLPNATAEQAHKAAERLRSAFENSDDNGLITISVSIGIAERGHNEDFDSLLRRADAALYHAKDEGRNCCEVAQ